MPIALLQTLLDAQSNTDSALGVIFIGDRDPEQRHEAVIAEVQDRAGIPLHLVKSGLEKAMQERVHRFVTILFSQDRRIGNITAEHCDLLAFPGWNRPNRQGQVREHERGGQWWKSRQRLGRPVLMWGAWLVPGS
jgi:hypothetical protein